MAPLRSRLGCAGVALALLVAVSARAVPPSSAELKAAFLIAFGDFVQWPESNERAPRPLVIGVVSAPEIADQLEKLSALEPPERRIAVLRLARVTPAVRCHVLYVPPDGEDKLPWRQLTSQAVLLVGESAEFEARGGTIRFLSERNRVRLRVNLPAAIERGLNISSRLLRVAEVKREP